MIHEDRLRRRAALALAVASALTGASVARADKNWNTAVSSGNWNTPSNWVENAVPISGDSVFVNFGDATDHTITYDGSYSSSNEVFIRNSGAGNTTLSTAASFNLTAMNLKIGDIGRGAANQSAGTYTIKNALTLGSTAFGTGTYTLSGSGAINIDGSIGSSPRLNVGDFGVATFTQSGGSINVGPGISSSYVMVGQNAGSDARYIMTGGTLTSAYLIGIGYWPASGSTPAARGTFEQSGGSVVATDSLDIANYGVGTYIQTGGTVSAGFSGPGGFFHRLYVGHNAGAKGSYTLSGTGVLTTAETMMGYNPGATGTFVQSGGTHNTGKATIGQFGNCTYTQTAGTFNLTTTLSVAANPGAIGTYTLAGGALNAATLYNRGNVVWSGGTYNVPALTLLDGGKMILSPGAAKVLQLNTLNIDTALGSKLDLGDNKLITPLPVGTWTGSTYTGVTGLIRSGRNGGGWSGAGIVTSMTDALTGYTSLAIATAQETGRTGLPFAGITVSASDVLVMYTYGGDANLSGNVDIDDYGQIDFNLATGGTRKGWFNGDFDYNGIIDVDDYGIIDFTVGTQGAPFDTAPAIDLASVPEPTSLSLLSLAPLILSRRASARRSRSRLAPGR